MQTIPTLANEYVTVYESPDPATVFTYTPGIARLASGRLLATLDIGGPGVLDLPGPKMYRGKGARASQGKAYVSDDGGRSWEHRLDFPFVHARPFIAGDSVYVLGHSGDLAIIRSDDGGDTWSKPALLTDGDSWHQSACNVLYVGDRLYLVMEKRMEGALDYWPVSLLAPVLMSARVTDDLTLAASWCFSEARAFRDLVPEPVGIGAPFFPVGATAPNSDGDRRTMAPIGWLETNVVQFNDPDHVWYDPTGRTFYLWMRSHTGTSNLACIAKAQEDGAGKIKVGLATAPSGKPMVYIPCPGGHMRFHIIRDEGSGLFWLLSSQPTDSMTRPDRLPADRYNLPNNERHRLALYFSRNCVDWLMAGIVAIGQGPRQARHYASMAIDGDDLVVLSRSGDERAKSAHDGNIITFHRVEQFRSLVY